MSFHLVFPSVFLRWFLKIFWQHLIPPPRIFWLLAYVPASQNFDTERMGVFALIQISISPRCGIWFGTRWVIFKIYWSLPVTRGLDEPRSDVHYFVVLNLFLSDLTACCVEYRQFILFRSLRRRRRSLCWPLLRRFWGNNYEAVENVLTRWSNSAGDQLYWRQLQPKWGGVSALLTQRRGWGPSQGPAFVWGKSFIPVCLGLGNGIMIGVGIFF